MYVCLWQCVCVFMAVCMCVECSVLCMCVECSVLCMCVECSVLCMCVECSVLFILFFLWWCGQLKLSFFVLCGAV